MHQTKRELWLVVYYDKSEMREALLHRLFVIIEPAAERWPGGLSMCVTLWEGMTKQANQLAKNRMGAKSTAQNLTAQTTAHCPPILLPPNGLLVNVLNAGNCDTFI